MEIGFYVGLGVWLLLLAVASTAKAPWDYGKLVVGTIIYIGIPTFIGHLIERFL